MDQIATFIATSPWLILFLVLLLVTILIIGSRILFKFKPTQISQEQDLSGGYKVSIIASFRGLKFLRLLSVGRNNIYPKLILFPDRIAFTVMIPTEKKLSDIELIDVLRTVATENVIVHFKNNPLTFSANTMNRDRLKAVIQFFADKHVPLSLRAKEFLQT